MRAAINAANANGVGQDTIVFKTGLEGTIKLTGGQIEITGSMVLAGPGSSKITVDANAASRIFDVYDGDLNRDSNVTISGLTLINGYVASSGGAIVSNENLTVVRCVISQNTADGAFCVGGGIAAFGKRFTLLQSRIEGNECKQDRGGGVWVEQQGLIDRCTIARNQALDGGGLIASNGALTIRNSTISGNDATGVGGGVYGRADLSQLNIANSTITGNNAGGQGGGLSTDGPLTTITNSTFTYNVALSSGGGLSSTGSMSIDRSTFSGNTSLSGARGGGIRHAAGSFALTNSTVSANRAELDGGGICVTGTSAALIRACTISGNIAGAGAGVLSESNPLTIDRSLISGNSALNGDGGGIVQQSGSLLMTSSTVSRNRADQGASGGIRLVNLLAGSTIRNSLISANSSGNGGGLSILDCSNSVTIQNSTISGNRAAAGGGLSLTSNSAILIIQNSTIAFNEASIEGGGIRARFSDVSLESTIVANNRAPGSPDLFSSEASSEFFATYSLIGSTAGANFFNTGLSLVGVDPLLAPLANNGGPTQTHALKRGSPAINHGSLSVSLPYDQRGRPFLRKVGGAVDIGAFERQ